MAYSSRLSDAEWEVLEPVLKESLPKKKQTRPSAWTINSGGMGECWIN